MTTWRRPEEKLTVEIGDINGVHIDDVDVVEARKHLNESVTRFL
jgi:hypothetical protein